LGVVVVLDKPLAFEVGIKTASHSVHPALFLRLRAANRARKIQRRIGHAILLLPLVLVMLINSEHFGRIYTPPCRLRGVTARSIEIFQGIYQAEFFAVAYE
jgi:hypothetical protein